MSSWTTEEVLTEYDKWLWSPPDATVARTERVHLYVRRGEATLLSADFAGGTEEIVQEARRLAAEHGAEKLIWVVSPVLDPPDLPDVLASAGGTVFQRTEICGYALDGNPTLTMPPDIDAHAVETSDDSWAALRIRSSTWPTYDPPTQADVDRDLQSSGGGRYVAYYRSTPAGSAGVEVAGPAIRLWGGAVLPELRGKGAYRGLVAARVADAAAQGGELALVGALENTSAPILRRMGFTTYDLRSEHSVPTAEA